ncbi:hypothetical protein KDN24_02465 [Bacillus sp. Bva_UNVM-123]|uniref:hypothetical protein n=1 Tax=Bacillus sp. Bva_UNVM-123 TaxID=2829798 RepID=UPI00391EE793
MINTKPTPKHLETIQEYKKMFEKWDMWDFAYFDGSEYYFLTLYNQPIRGITGYLILNQAGFAIPFSEAKHPAYCLISYNTLVHFAISNILPQIHKEMAPYKQFVSLLQKHRAVILAESPNMGDSIHKMITYTEDALQNSDKLNEIIRSLSYYQDKITKEVGFFDDTLLAKMQEEGAKYNEIMYVYGLREREMMPDYQQLIDFIHSNASSRIPRMDKWKLLHLIKAAMQSNKGALEKSLAGFEQDENGNRVTFDLNNIRESLQKQRTADGVVAFNKKSIPLIRNQR